MRDQRPPLTFSHITAMPPSVADCPAAGSDQSSRLFGTYRAWRKVKYVAAEIGMDPIEAWRLVKSQRLATWRPIGVSRCEGGQFGLCPSHLLQEPLLLIDRSTVDVGALSGVRTLQKRLHAMHGDGQLLARRKIQTSMDEAAESSIMEGAATTRKEAIELLRSGRPPQSLAERMVVNNHLAMQQIKQWLDRPLSIEMLLELQEMLTEGTIDDVTGAGRLRRPEESVRVVDTRTNEDIFTPPPTDFLVGLLRSICDFANREHTGADFIHPIVKGAALHFLVGYAHPFVDGNGRTARAVFYWHALRHGYGIFEFLSISEIIRKGYAKYPQAYIDCELDDGDLTYFAFYHADIIQQALERLAEHLEVEQEKTQRSQSFLKLAKDLNLRQRLILEHGLRHPLTHYTVKSHMNSNGIVAPTARADLDDLVRRRLMFEGKKGRQVIYMIAPTVEARLNRATRR